MTRVDVLIIGQGISGTFLCRELDRQGLTYIVMDEERRDTASRAAAGLINPVTGRRFVKTWMIDALLPYVREVYGDSLKPAKVVDFFPTPQMRLAFVKRCEEGADYLSLPSSIAEEHRWDGLFRYELGYGVIEPCFLVDMPGLLGQARRELKGRGVLLEECFIAGEMELGKTGVRYRNVAARWVIFCDGVAGARAGYFERLPFAPNKGEALIIEAPDLKGGEVIFKKGMSMVPWSAGMFWVGSSYEWAFDDAGPTTVFREQTEAMLRQWLRVPFRTVEHLASVRPATLERRPFVGLHPVHPVIGILNGMGTKGCSLAPFFARQLAEVLVTGEPIQADADVRRFRRVLGG
jgi:glycine/D-amino acid oxidase-like deaminating enzyme